LEVLRRKLVLKHCSGRKGRMTIYGKIVVGRVKLQH
jgi:hypothetical protein